MNPYGTALMSDGFPMDRYGRSEKHISFAFTLKADTQLGRAKEEKYLLLSVLIVITSPFWLLAPVRASSSKIHLKTLRLRLRLSGRAVALVFSEYLHLRLCGKFAICQYQHLPTSQAAPGLNNTFTFQVRQRGIIIEIELKVQHQ